MRPETDAFLELVRDAENPSRADEERVRSALDASLAAGITSSAFAHAPVGKTWLGKTTAALGSFGSKLSLIATFSATALVAADSGRSSGGSASWLVAIDRPIPNAEHRTAPLMVAEPVVEPEKPAAIEVPARPRASERRASTLRAELALLREVQAALRRGDGAGALRALDSHKSTDRKLLAERRAARILALCLLGRVDEARRAAVDFSNQHSDSVQRDAIAHSCAGPQRILPR